MTTHGSDHRAFAERLCPRSSPAQTLLQALYEGGSQSPISDLEPRQVHLFYEAVGLMVGSATQVKEVEEYLT